MKQLKKARPRILTSLVFTLWLLMLSGISAAETVVLTADRIIDGNSKKALQNSVIVVDGESITAIGGRELIPEGATVIDLGDATLMPGMIDAHMHPQLTTGDYQSNHLQQSSAYKTLRATVVLQQNLMAGWTGVRVVGDGDVFYGDVDIKRVIEEGVIVGPHMAVAGHYLSITGGGGDVNYMSPEQTLIADGLVVDGVDEIRLSCLGGEPPLCRLGGWPSAYCCLWKCVSIRTCQVCLFEAPEGSRGLAQTLFREPFSR